LVVLGIAERQYLLTQIMPDEFFGGHAQVHALDAHADLEPSRRVAVETQTVEPLLAVGVVVEPAPCACLRQADGSDLFEPNGPPVRELVGGPAPRDARGDVVRGRLCADVVQDAFDRRDRFGSVVEGVEQAYGEPGCVLIEEPPHARSVIVPGHDDVGACWNAEPFRHGDRLRQRGELAFCPAHVGEPRVLDLCEFFGGRAEDAEVDPVQARLRAVFQYGCPAFAIGGDADSQPCLGADADDLAQLRMQGRFASGEVELVEVKCIAERDEGLGECGVRGNCRRGNWAPLVAT
jgi:hypothetical protein